MARPTTWRDLRIGIVALAALAVLIYVILVYGRLGRLPGDTYHAFVKADEAQGIIKGSEVWLNGQKVGAVRDIDFLPPIASESRRLLLDLELVSRHQDAIRHDSNVQIRSGGSLIGAPVVYITAGSTTSPVVADGDTLVAADAVDLGSIGARYADVAEEIPLIIADAKSVFALARSREGTIGAALTGGAPAGLSGLRTRVGGMAAALRNGKGTLGLAMGGRSELTGRAAEAMARADSIRTLIGSTETSLGRFRRDSSLATTIGDIRNELSIVGALLAEPRGTLGRLALDSALVAGVADVEREMSALLADVKKRPFRYLTF